MHARVLAEHRALLGTDLRASGGRRLAGSVLAVLVHLVTLSLAVGAAWIWTTAAFPVAKAIVTVVLLVVAWEVRPRLGRVPREGEVLVSATAPGSFAVLAEVARATGSKPPHVLVVSPEFNASVGRAGIRRRLVMTIGLPLWQALDDRERVAVLGHECGHEVNGDLRSTLVVGTAIESLQRWASLLLPDVRATRQRWRFGARNSTGSFFAIAEYLVPLILLPLSVTVGLLAVGLERIAARSGQRAEYRADELAGAAAGTDATVAMLDQFFVAGQCMAAMRLAGTREPDGDVWAAESRFLRAVTPAQRERWRRIAAREEHRTDASHPPTLLRQEMLRSKPPVTGSLRLDPQLLATMTAELAAFAPALARRLRDADAED